MFGIALLTFGIYWLVITDTPGMLPTDPYASAAAGCVSYYSSATSFTLTTPLTQGRTYYWTIQAFNNTTSPYTQGQYAPAWSFTTQPAIPQTGTINITSNRAGAPFILNGPSGVSGTTPYSNSAAGVGSYTVTWNPISGYTTPTSQTQTLTAGGNISFNGNYTSIPQTGTINITSNRAGAPFILNGPSGVSGTTPYSNSAAGVGSYTVTWNPISGYTTPASQTQTLTAGGNISFNGNYILNAVTTVPTSSWHNYNGGAISWRVVTGGIEVSYPKTFRGFPKSSTQGLEANLRLIIQQTWNTFGTLFVEAGKTYTVPPIVFLAIAVTESSGNASIVGGLMQTSTYNGMIVSARDSIMNAAKGWLGPSYKNYNGDPIFQAVAYNGWSVRLATQYSKPDGSGRLWGKNDWKMKMVSSNGNYDGSYAWRFAANFNIAVSVIGTGMIK
jgi:hypothetical protein